MQDTGLQPQDFGSPIPNQNQDPMGGMPDFDEGGDMGEDGFDDKFDRDFDAGVEADEDEDPENYIRQLTGKLSQKINSYVSDNGNDESLTKYAANMVIRAAADGMSEKGKKELIKTVNTTDSGEDEGLDDEDENLESNEPDGGDDMDFEGGGDDMDFQDDEQEQPVNEVVMTKKRLRECFMNMSMFDGDNDFTERERPAESNKQKSVFSGKVFNNFSKRH